MTKNSNFLIAYELISYSLVEEMKPLIIFESSTVSLASSSNSFSSTNLKLLQISNNGTHSNSEDLLVL